MRHWHRWVRSLLFALGIVTLIHFRLGLLWWVGFIVVFTIVRLIVERGRWEEDEPGPDKMGPEEIVDWITKGGGSDTDDLESDKPGPEGAFAPVTNGRGGVPRGGQRPSQSKPRAGDVRALCFAAFVIGFAVFMFKFGWLAALLWAIGFSIAYVVVSELLGGPRVPPDGRTTAGKRRKHHRTR